MFQTEGQWRRARPHNVSGQRKALQTVCVTCAWLLGIVALVMLWRTYEPAVWSNITAYIGGLEESLSAQIYRTRNW